MYVIEHYVNCRMLQFTCRSTCYTFSTEVYVCVCVGGGGVWGGGRGEGASTEDLKDMKSKPKLARATKHEFR